MGLVMVGFAGHAVFPTIKNDMAEKKHYNVMVDVTYVFVLICYVGIAAAGYLMFGDAADEQITLNLGKSLISHIIIWVVISNPICKVGPNPRRCSVTMICSPTKPAVIRSMNLPCLVDGAMEASGAV